MSRSRGGGGDDGRDVSTALTMTGKGGMSRDSPRMGWAVKRRTGAGLGNLCGPRRLLRWRSNFASHDARSWGGREAEEITIMIKK